MSNNVDYKYFTLDEFKCSETGENEISPTFVTRLDHLRHLCEFPFTITSGYRSPQHSAERSKPAGSVGQHTLGMAADIAVRNSEQRYTLIKNAMLLGFTGIGVAKGFVHVDTRATEPVVWVY